MPDRFTISSSFFGTASFTDPSIWTDGIIPTASDNIFIRGLSRTVTGQYEFWPTTRSFFIINNTALLPESGSLYTYTDRDQLVKLDYRGISGAVTLLEVTVDKSASAPWGEGYYNDYISYSFPDKRGGSIINGSTIQFQPGNVVLSGSLTASIRQTNIENGGCLELRGTSSYFNGNFINVNGGTFGMFESSSVIWNNPFLPPADTGSVVNTSASYFTMNFTPFTQVYLEGEEVRTNTTLSLDSPINSHYLSVVSSSNFEVGDCIFVGEENIQTGREDDNTRFNQGIIYGETVSSYDEVFNVAGKDTGSIPNKLYIQRMNGLEGKVLATASSTELIVDEDRYQVGDEIIINNQARTIIQVDDYDFLLKDYDFTHPTASLDEWETDPSISPFYANWNIAPGKGLTLQSNESFNTYRHNYVKDLMLDRVKIEAWISNGFPISGSTSTSPSFKDLINPYSIVIHADPFLDDIETSVGTGGATSTYSSRTYLALNPTGSIYMTVKNAAIGGTLNKPNLIGVNNFLDENKFTLESYKGSTIGYIDDVKVSEYFNAGGTFWGRVGIATTNNKIICSRFKVYNKCQKITLNSSTSVSVGDIAYETGTEFFHKSGDKVIKLHSIITDPLNLKNKAFAYQGAEEYENNGVFPYIYSTNNNGTARNFPSSLFISPLSDWGENTMSLGQSTTSSITFDFTVPIGFDNFGFVENFLTTGQNYTQSAGGGLSFSGSNNTFNWIPITGGIDVRRRIAGNYIRDWQLPTTQSFRYIRLQMSGITSMAITSTGNPSQNVLRQFVLRSGSLNTFMVNNASDLNIGDRIVIINHLSRLSSDQNRSSVYNLLVLSGSSIDTPLEDYFTITNKIGNQIFVDKKINFIIKKGNYIIKVNKKINFLGNFASGSVRVGRFWGTQDPSFPTINNSQFQHIRSFKNVGFQHLTDAFPNYAANSSGLFGYFGINYFNPFNPMRIQGCSFYNSFPDGQGWSNDTETTKFHIHIRHNIVHFGGGWQCLRPFSSLTLNGLPYITTGNTFINNGTWGNATGNNGKNIVNYNTFYNSGLVNVTANAQNPTTNYTNANNFIVIRNLFLQGNALLNISLNPLVTDDVNTLNIKSNKLIGGTSTTISNAGIVRYTGIFKTPIENFLLPARQGMDGYTATNLNTGGGFLPQKSNNPGSVGQYLSNYNKYNIDIWNNTKGIIIKDKKDDWYKYIPLSSSTRLGFSNLDIMTPFISAVIQKTDNTTSSFYVGFDYYHDNSQISQIQSVIFERGAQNPFIYYNIVPITGGASPYTFSQSLFIPASSSFAGGLSLSFYKNGKLAEPIGLIPKSSQPTRFERIFSLEGEGFYEINLNQDSAPRGYVALKNITSRVVGEQTGSLDVKSNGFSMKYFNGLSTLQFSNTNNQYPQTNPKFRLKGAKLF